jgi:hypothetical protein
MNRPKIIITEEMINAANDLVRATEVHRTKASPFDTVVGHLGEFAVAHYLYGDWRKHHVGNNKGQVDFIEEGIEVKTSAFPFREDLNLLVREDYATKRSPNYIQVIINIESRDAEAIKAKTEAIICGWASSEQVKNAPLKDMGSKFGGSGGYRCRAIPIGQLNDIASLIRNKIANG